MGIQTIVTANGERLVVLPEAEYEALIEAAEDAADLRDFADFRRRLNAGEEELIPAEIVDRLSTGENRIKVWRDYRGLTVNALAKKAGIAQAFLSQIETGKRDGTVDTLLKIAEGLGVSVEDLVEQKNIRVERTIARQPGLTVAEIAKQVHASESHVRKCCEWLLGTGRVVRRGQPARFYPREPSGL